MSSSSTIARPDHFRRPLDGPGPATVVLDARVVTGAGGGPDKTILNSPRFLDDLGYRMVCGYLHPPEDAGFDVLRRQADRCRAPLVSIPDRGPWDWRVVTELLAVCKRERVAIWHGHDYKTNALGLLLKRAWPMRLVSTVHGWVHHTARTPIYYKIDRLCLARYERVICVSEDLFDECLTHNVRPENCVLLENAIDTEEYTRRRTTPEAKARLGFPIGGLLLGGIGRLEPEKAFDQLLRAAKELLAAGIDVRVVVVGEGSDRARLEALAAELGLADRVTLPGWQADVRDYFEAIDVFVLSSLREGLPNVLLEAMAMEVPCVATRIAGIPRLIRDGQSGTLVSPGNLPALSAALLRLARCPELRDQFRKEGRRTVETRYSFPTRMRMLAGIYDELLGG
ncbi:MAG TPA: glycosyltransferase [Fimbriiglobus sp.]|jgi:glycosyltransferase involved in cell wall biosynthesis